MFSLTSLSVCLSGDVAGGRNYPCTPKFWHVGKLSYCRKMFFQKYQICGWKFTVVTDFRSYRQKLKFWTSIVYFVGNFARITSTPKTLAKLFQRKSFSRTFQARSQRKLKRRKKGRKRSRNIPASVCFFTRNLLPLLRSPATIALWWIKKFFVFFCLGGSFCPPCASSFLTSGVFENVERGPWVHSF